MRHSFFALPLVAALAACTTAVPQSAPAPPPRQPAASVPATDPTPPAPSGLRQPQVMRLPGLEDVIGASQSSLVRRFGSPRLDVREGDVRKLQFSGEACVLDVYLYPQRQEAEPVATWVEARRASDGQDVDRAACVAALRQR